MTSMGVRRANAALFHSLSRGNGDSMYTRKARQHGKPLDVIRDDQPEAREGQAGHLGVTERFVVLLKPGNAGGGKEPR
jgi:hypothetical protein